MIRRPPRSTLFPTRRSSDLRPSAERIKRTGVPHSSVLCKARLTPEWGDRKSTRLNSSHITISYAVFCLKKKKKKKKKKRKAQKINNKDYSQSNVSHKTLIFI